MDAYDQIASLLPGAGHGRRSPAPFAISRVAGPDAVDFLHRLCSQDVARLPVGGAAPAAFLSPKGKLLAVAVLGRVGTQEVVVETRAADAVTVHQLLDRYHFAERLTISPTAVDQACTELAGVDLPAARSLEPWTVTTAADGTVILAGRRRGAGFVRCHGAKAAVEVFAADVPPIDPALAECLRIVTGQVLVGIDTEAGTLALEPDLEDHVSTTKGCYTGQEIVARIHTYGHVNRRIVPIAFASDSAPAGDAQLFDADGDPVGRLRSTCRLPGTNRHVALAVLPTAFLDTAPSIRVGGAAGPSAELVSLRST